MGSSNADSRRKSNSAPEVDPRTLSTFQKIKWLFTAPKSDEDDENDSRDRDRGRAEKEEPELTEEEKARLEYQRIKKRNLVIFIALVLLTAITSGLCYWRYTATHVTDKDIARCHSGFKSGDYIKAFKYCYKARDVPDAEIMYALARMYETGKGVPPDEFDTESNRRLALKYYEMAASNNLLRAQVKLGNDYFNGSVIARQDDDKAIKWLRHAARNSDEKAAEKLVTLLLKKKKTEEAVQWLQELAESGNPDASYHLAEIFSSGEDVKPDYERAFSACAMAAEKGHADAEHLLALMYESGLGTNPDFRQAYIYETRAAAHGSVEAAYQSGLMTENGIGTEANVKKAVEYYESAAAGGHDGAAFKLGSFYENGIGVERDYMQALTWYSSAANRGNASAMIALGRMHQNGLGTTASPEDAFFWYQKAAETPNLEAYFNLGLAYIKGIGTAPDAEKAMEYFTVVAATGYAPAEYELGLIYFQQEKYEQAAAWFKKSFNQGHAFSAAYLGFMSARGLGEPLSNYMAYFYFTVSYQLYPADTTLDNIRLVKSKLSKEQQNAAEIRAQKFMHQIKFSHSSPSVGQSLE